MSTPADFKRFEQKKAEQEKRRMAKTVMSYPQYSSSGSSNQYNGGTSWLYQPDHHRTKQKQPEPAQDFTKDQPSGWYFSNPQPHNALVKKQPYRNMNNQNRKQYPKGKKGFVLPTVKEAPVSLTTLDLTIEPSNIYCFRGKFNELSNLFQAPLEIDTNSYTSVEHYYQAAKVFTLAGKDKAAEMSKAKDPAGAKSLARRLLRDVPKEAVDEWKLKDAPKILKLAILEKFKQNADLKKKLLGTGSTILAHSFEGENLYATNCSEEGVKAWAKENSGSIYKLPTDCTDPVNIDYIPLVAKGRNLLGAILMIVRKELEGTDCPKKTGAGEEEVAEDKIMAALDMLTIQK